MKKSSFVTMVLATVSGMLFAIGMCMALIPQWQAFKPGIIFGCIGLAGGVITYIVWRRLTHQKPIAISGKAIGTAAAGIGGVLVLGVGMCFCMVWNDMIKGIIIGLVGIVILLALIPLTKGITD